MAGSLSKQRRSHISVHRLGVVLNMHRNLSNMSRASKSDDGTGALDILDSVIDETRGIQENQ